jgi:predicted DNA binding protein
LTREIIDVIIKINKPDCPLLTHLVGKNLDLNFYNIVVSENKVSHIIVAGKKDLSVIKKISRDVKLGIRYKNINNKDVLLSPCSFCKTLLKYKGLPTGLKLDKDEKPVYRIFVPKRSLLKNFVSDLEESGLEPDLLKIDLRLRIAKLTPTQIRALILAYENGFFDYPKKINLEMLSWGLDIKILTIKTSCFLHVAFVKHC